MNDRRRDAELREWHELMTRTGDAIGRHHTAVSDQIRVLSELLQESISVSESKVVKAAMQRKHVKDVLRVLSEAADHRLERAVIFDRLDLEQANLTRVINLALDAGLIERSVQGRNVTLEMTRTGREILAAEVMEQTVEDMATHISRSVLRAKVWRQMVVSYTNIVPSTGTNTHLEQAPFDRGAKHMGYISREELMGLKKAAQTRLPELHPWMVPGNDAVDDETLEISE